GELGTQVAVERGVVVKPPESRPGEGDETHARPAQPLQLPDCRSIIRRVAPRLARALEEGQCAAARGEPGFHFPVTDQDKGVPRRDQCHEIVYRPLPALY